MPLMDPTVETVLKPPLLFLHGQAFTSAVWARTYSLQLAAQRGHRAVAIDLPGFGHSVAGSERIDPYVFLATVIHELHLGRPVIVSPRFFEFSQCFVFDLVNSNEHVCCILAYSLSGKYALPYLLREPHLASQRLRGFVAIAPVNTENFASDAYFAVRSCSHQMLVICVALSLSPAQCTQIYIFAGAHAGALRIRRARRATRAPRARALPSRARRRAAGGGGGRARVLRRAPDAMAAAARQLPRPHRAELGAIALLIPRRVALFDMSRLPLLHLLPFSFYGHS